MRIITLSLFTIFFTFQVALCQSNPFGDSRKAMAEAVAKEDTVAMAEIIKKEVTADSKLQDKNLCLLLVVDYGIMQSTKCLIEIGAEVDCVAPKSGATPFLTVASRGYLNITKYLLSEGANINAKNIMAANALVLASRKGNIEMVKFLVEKGIDIHAKMDGGYNARDMAKGKEVKKYLKEIGLK